MRSYLCTGRRRAATHAGQARRRRRHLFCMRSVVSRSTGSTLIDRHVRTGIFWPEDARHGPSTRCLSRSCNDSGTAISGADDPAQCAVRRGGVEYDRSSCR